MRCFEHVVGKRMIDPYSDDEKKYIKYLVDKHVRKPFWKQRMFHYLLIIAVTILCIAVVLVALPIENNQYIPSSILDEFGWSEVRAIDTAKEVIKEKLRFPSSAQFSNLKATLESENVSFNEYKVTGAAESLNAYGLTIKNSFYVTLRCFTNSYYEVVESGVL